MITGFNTDVEFLGRVYHVQTEDKGRSNPVVESLVYCRGEIIESRRTGYEEVVAAGAFDEVEVHRRMEVQHKTLIREIRSGKFNAEELRPFGHSIITNRSLDEVVLTFLRENVPLERLKLAMRGPKVLHEGARPTFRLTVIESSTERPICGASVSVQLVTGDKPPVDLFAAPTDESGQVDAAFVIPPVPDGEPAILCRVEAEGRTAQLRRLVKKRLVPSAGRS